MKRKPLPPPPTHWSQSLPLSALLASFPTPLYLYHLPELRQRAQLFRETFTERVDLLYAVKANANPNLLSLMLREQLVDGLDIASPGELALTQKLGWLPTDLSYTGPAKRTQDLEEAIQYGVGIICIESMRELKTFAELITRHPNSPTQCMVRLTPAAEARAFGLKITGVPTPFGFDEEDLPSLISHIQRLLQNDKHFPFAGIHVHAGSQCLSAKAMSRNYKQIFSMASRFIEANIPVHSINVGGGFGVCTWLPYQELSLHGVFQHLKRAYIEWGHQTTIRIEPGRSLISPAGVFLATVVSTKESRGQSFVLVDGGTNQYQEARATELEHTHKRPWVINLSRPDTTNQCTQICGPLCTPRDRIGKDVTLPTPHIDDVLCWPNAGGYGWSASPLFFLGHDTPCEVAFDNGEFHLWRPSLSLAALPGVTN